MDTGSDTGVPLILRSSASTGVPPQCITTDVWLQRWPARLYPQAGYQLIAEWLL